MVNHENLPYIECARLISKMSLLLARCGESQFIPFASLTEITQGNFEKSKVLEEITKFDICFGIKLGEQTLSIFLLNKIYLELKELITVTKQNSIHQLKLVINKIDKIPPTSKKITEKLVYINNNISEINREKFLKLNKIIATIEDNINSNNTYDKKIINSIFEPFDYAHIKCILINILNLYEILWIIDFENQKNEAERYTLFNQIQHIKLSILTNNIDKIYKEFIILINEISYNLNNSINSFYANITHNIYADNKIYCQRLCFQLSKKEFSFQDLNNLCNDLLNYANKNEIKITEIPDEEVTSFLKIVDKNIISSTRLEIRLNDYEYPLSVAYRESIKKIIENVQ